MRAGELRHHMSLQNRQTTRDPDTGDVIVGWVELAKIWAEIVPLSARDFIAAGANQSKVSARITIRYRQDINHSMRLVYRGSVYRIEGILPDPISGQEYLTLPVSAGVDSE